MTLPVAFKLCSDANSSGSPNWMADNPIMLILQVSLVQRFDV